MKPSAKQLKYTLSQVNQQIKDSDLFVEIVRPNGERIRLGALHTFFSAVVACAEGIEKLERVQLEVMSPAIGALMQDFTSRGGKDPVVEGDKKTAAPGAPVTAEAATEEVEEENLPPLRATVTQSGPASAPQPVATSKIVTPVAPSVQ